MADGRADESNDALEAQLEEARGNARAILKVVESLEHADSTDAAMLAALGSVREAFGWTYGTFWTLDEGERVLRFSIESGSIAEEFRRMTVAARFPEGNGSLPGRAWKSRDLVFVPDFGEERTFPRAEVARRHGIRSGLCFPIIVAGNVIGTMDFLALEILSPTPERLDVLRNVGRLVSMALTRLRDAEAEQETAREATTIGKLLDVLGHATNADEAARMAMNVIRESFGWEYGGYWTLDPQDRVVTLACKEGHADEEFLRLTSQYRYREGEGIVGTAWKRRELLHVTADDIKGMPRHPSAVRSGFTGAVCLPIFAEGAFAGALEFFTKQHQKKQADQLGGLRNMNGLISLTIERLLGLDRKQREAEEPRRRSTRSSRWSAPPRGAT